MNQRFEKLQGIILKRVNFSESDKIVTAFTRTQGKISFRAPGVRRLTSRRAPHLELFQEVELGVHLTRGMPILSEAQTKKSFPNLNKNIQLIGLAFYVAEVIDKLLPEKQAHIEVYDRLVGVLEGLDGLEGKDEATRLVKDFVCHLLWEIGFLPEGEYPQGGINNLVEELAEKRIKSKKFLEEI